MSINARLKKVEEFVAKGSCPVCGFEPATPGRVDCVEVVEYGRGEPLGFYYEKPWPDKGRYPYPPDPRPACPACGERSEILLLTAVYDEGEWAELQTWLPASPNVSDQLSGK
jgi:hypothetical protein